MTVESTTREDELQTDRQVTADAMAIAETTLTALCTRRAPTAWSWRGPRGRIPTAHAEHVESASTPTKPKSVPAKPSAEYSKPNFTGNDTQWLGVDAKAPPEQSAPQNANAQQRVLVLMMATHIDSRGRLMSLVRCLDSLEAQQIKAYIGWHAVDAELRAQTLDILMAYAKRCKARPAFVEAAERRRQFEHYEALVEKAQADSKAAGRPVHATWCIFCDDDDVCSPERALVYESSVANAVLPATARALCCNDVVVRAQTRRAGLISIDGPRAVDRAIRSGDVVHKSMSEHWSFAVRLDLFRAFFERHGPGLLQHSLCDLRFREWLRNSTVPMPTFRMPAPDWVHFYDGSAAQHDHAHTDATPSDTARAARFGVKVGLCALMRSVGEMGFVIGFDGPILGHKLPAARRRRAALDLLLEALEKPQNIWKDFTEAERRTWRDVADDIAEELFAKAATFYNTK